MSKVTQEQREYIEQERRKLARDIASRLNKYRENTGMAVTSIELDVTHARTSDPVLMGVRVNDKLVGS